ncbi:MAG TPA: alpha/beta hydrolase, partial [Thermodesulfobacteriota bacterium]|nr:alpha/beta hydrolase [Thermodesulfobacteriota bacterium]
RPATGRAAGAPAPEGGAAGLVLAGIPLRLAVAVPRCKRLAARVCAGLLPRLAFDSGIDADALSRDPAVCAAYRSDPLVHRVVTARWFVEYEAARAAALADAGRVRCPVLLLHGGADTIAHPSGARQLAAALQGAPVTLRVYPDARHELFTDPRCPEVHDDLARWLARHALFS